CTQSTANRFGASNLSTPSSCTACNGRSQVFTCCSGNSLLRCASTRGHSSVMSLVLEPLLGGGGVRGGRGSLPASAAKATLPLTHGAGSPDLPHLTALVDSPGALEYPAAPQISRPTEPWQPSAPTSRARSSVSARTASVPAWPPPMAA